MKPRPPAMVRFTINGSVVVGQLLGGEILFVDTSTARQRRPDRQRRNDRRMEAGFSSSPILRAARRALRFSRNGYLDISGS